MVERVEMVKRRIQSIVSVNRAFTLFELILVIFLMGVLYSLVSFSFDRYFDRDENLKFEHIKSYLKSTRENNGSLVELVCYDRCQKCVIFEDTVLKKELNLNLDKDLEVLDMDELGDFRVKEFEDRLVDDDFERICFEFKLFSNDSSSKLLVYNFGRYYVFNSYFSDVNISFDEDEAKRAFFDKELYPTEVEDYYYK
jgi:hypothetical protein